MPVKLKTQISESISIAVWQIAETEEFFYDFLKLLPEDELRIKNCKLQKVRLQKLACRAALAVLLGSSKVEITYTSTGQPQLKNNHISFSHTKNNVAVALSKTPIGIDVEELTPRILPLYPRFLSEQEMATCDVTNLQDLYYYWCAKEAMYKWFAKKNLDFIEDLQVIKNEKKGVVCHQHTLQLFDFELDNLIIVLCIHQN